MGFLGIITDCEVQKQMQDSLAFSSGHDGVILVLIYSSALRMIGLDAAMTSVEARIVMPRGGIRIGRLGAGAPSGGRELSTASRDASHSGIFRQASADRPGFRGRLRADRSVSCGAGRLRDDSTKACFYFHIGSSPWRAAGARPSSVQADGAATRPFGVRSIYPFIMRKGS